MHRKGVELLFNSAFKRVSLLSTVNRLPPSRLHLSRHFSTEHPAPRVTLSKEPVFDFSNNDPNQFGSLHPQKDLNKVLDEMPEEPDDKLEFLIQEETGRKVRRSVDYYTRLIQKFISERKIADAIDVLEERMLKRDKVKPNYYIYNLLINGCASVGYTVKAFKLYNRMKESQVKRTAATYTGLLNACANTPFQEDGLMRVNALRNELNEKGIPLNVIHYNTLIKAYARLNDIKAAFLVIDEMICKRFPINEGTFIFLLQACASNKEAGFRHALILWHKMRRKRIMPDIFVYNNFLRCVRDCGIGNVHETIDNMKQIAAQKNTWRPKAIEGNTANLIPADEENTFAVPSETTTLPERSDDLSLLERIENRPNLLDPVPHLGSIIELKDVNTPTDRLLLLGGFRNVLNEMKLDKVQPDIKTFTMLLDMIPPTLTAEDTLLKEMRKNNIPIDIDFCNMLIKKRAFRLDYENGRATLELIQSSYLNPDIVTFGVLALCCRTKHEALQIMHDMKQFGYRLNVEIMGGMLRVACSQFNYEYIMFVLKLMKNMEIQPSEKFMEILKALINKSQEYFNIKDNRKKDQPNKVINPKTFENYKIFKDYYKQWKKEVTVFIPPHPYAQFKQRFESTEEDGEVINPKVEPKKKAQKPAEVVHRGSPTKWKQVKSKPQIIEVDFSRPVDRRPKSKFINDYSEKENENEKMINWKGKLKEKVNDNEKVIKWKKKDTGNTRDE